MHFKNDEAVFFIEDTSKNNEKYLSILVVAVPFILYVAHALLLRNWIVDDAGISFSYARNLAEGNGLVAQPGSEPVEGFSNFLWVLMLVPFFWCKLFDPIITPKVLSAALVLVTYIFLYRSLRGLSRYALPATFFVLMLLSLTSPFVIWTTSGMENALYALLAAAIFFFIIRYAEGTAKGTIPKSTITVVAILTAMIAMTRPDGALYFFIFPTLAVINVFIHKISIRKILHQEINYLLVFAAVFGSFLIYRYFYFHDIVPNTYYVKGHGHLSLLRMAILAASPTIIVGYISLLKRPNLKSLALMLMLFCSIDIFIVMPDDWMGWYRFATPVFMFIFISFFLLGEFVISKTFKRKYLRIAGITALTIFPLIGGAFYFTIDTKKFTDNPTVPFASVADRFGEYFNNVAGRLDLQNGSILLPDLGGSLYYSDLKIYDLSGLCDKTIARTLGKDNEAFHNYVFETIKPSIIHTHELFAFRADFDGDMRFRRDYVPIYEKVDDWVLNKYQVEVYSGDYVRREIVEKKTDIFNELKRYR